MTKRINAKKKLSRKLGGSLWGQAKDSYTKRNYRPGQHEHLQKVASVTTEFSFVPNKE
jgi:small subunit ribosomal protein S4